MLQKLTLTLISLGCTAHLLAQSVELKSGVLQLQPVTTFTSHPDEAIFDGRAHYVLYFQQNPRASQRAALERKGIQLLQPLRQKAWTASVGISIDLSTPGPNMPTSYAHIPPKMKLHPSLSDRIEPGNKWKGSMELTVLPYDDVDVENLLVQRQFHQVNAQRTAPERGNMLVQATRKQLLELLSHPGVHWVEPPSAPGEPEDHLARGFHRVHPVASNFNNMPGLDGSGVSVAVNDDGFVGPHIDLKGRTEQSTVASDLTGDHGDMVAGIVGGAGNLDPYTAGMAPGSFIHVRQYDSSLPNTVTLHQNDGVMAFNSSYGNGCNDGYTALTEQVDQEIHDNRSLIQVFSAGNSGNSDCGYGAGSGWGNITGGHKIAKNAIATANLTSDGERVASSSRGPAEDGRIKPDIAANGNGQYSLDPNNEYAVGGGTSAASPGIVGTLALMYQGWRQLHGGNDPHSGLLKAFLLNTADDLGNPGPDYSFGWGRVNALRAWRAIEEGRYLTDTVDDNDLDVHTINVPAGVKQMRVMLYWMDPSGSPAAATALVNDLGLRATDPMGMFHAPWVLQTTPNPTDLAAPATTGIDDLNNMEQVAINDPAAGTWSFEVLGVDVPQGPQDYYIVHEFILPELEMVYPFGGECLPPGVHRVRWDGGDPSQGYEVSFSLNNGVIWSTPMNVPAGQFHFDLNLPTAVTAEALVRVQQGQLLDESGLFAIMGTPSNLQVASNCLDSAILSWDPISGATGYTVYMLGDMYMDSIGTTGNTTFTATGLQPNGQEWFSVSAWNDNAACSERAIAVQRPQGLFNCVLAIDLLAHNLASPPKSIPQCQLQDNDILFTIVNNGTSTLNNVDAFFSINNGLPIPQFVASSLAPMDSIEVFFSLSGSSLDPGLNELKVWGRVIGEQYPINDTIVQYINSQGTSTTLPYFEDWEGSLPCNDTDECDEVCSLGSSLAYNEPQPEIDVLEWRIDQNGTPSGGTGPSADHTLGNPVGKYAYVEATTDCNLMSAELVLPCMDVPMAPTTLTYWYHMDGGGMGDLHLDVFVDGDWELDVVNPISGDQGSAWQEAIVPLDNYAGETINVRFRAVTGPTFSSDIAIDDIGITSTVGVAELDNDMFLITPSDQPGVYTLHADPDRIGSLLTVSDALGRRVAPGITIQIELTLVDLQHLPQGIYLVTLEQDGTRYTQRLPRE